mmetsp:Transcript_17704/g.27389  ORF Transcript_17704/g.27389 Transcript_17704/m.27389 type:complete len:122 (+) Transcript_17704:151-516(+)
MRSVSQGISHGRAQSYLGTHVLKTIHNSFQSLTSGVAKTNLSVLIERLSEDPEVASQMWKLGFEASLSSWHRQLVTEGARRQRGEGAEGPRDSAGEDGAGSGAGFAKMNLSSALARIRKFQ